METKKILTAGFILLSLSALAQSITENRAGHIRSQGNLAGGYLFGQNDFTAYIAGDFDLFFSDDVSYTGEGWYNFKTHDKPTGLLENHALFGGFNYHPVKKGRWDPFIGLSPGMAIVKAGYNDTEGVIQETLGVAPLISGTVGCNYYIGSIFHLFVKARGVGGRFRGDSPEFTPLNEMKITAGLGWNVRLWKKS